MTRSFWQQLHLSPATLASLNEMVPLARGEDEPRKPQTIAVFSGGKARKTRIETVQDWHAQDPVTRIINAILISAVRQRVEVVTLEPGESGARVRFALGGREKDHISLPHLAAKPVAAQFQQMAALDGAQSDTQTGTIRLQIDERAFDLQLWSEPTIWGQRLEMRLVSL